ncbi:hypothetical protein ACO0LG_16575 [Undibacterium sp. Ji42W]|uniref:hypothetical protein n=1 Tax=Undibacterium sp. Ji42W TaxID=3413039 RepID=UPI003BEFC490
MTNTAEAQKNPQQKHLFSWIRLALFFCLMLYFLLRAIDLLHQAGCAQNPGVGGTIESDDLGLFSAGYQWLVMLSGAAIFATWPGVSKWRGLWRAFLFIVVSFCLSIALSVWYENDVAETCVRPVTAVRNTDCIDMRMTNIANIALQRI